MAARRNDRLADFPARLHQTEEVTETTSDPQQTSVELAVRQLQRMSRALGEAPRLQLGSPLHKDFQACWRRLAGSLDASAALPEVLRPLAASPCVPATVDDIMHCPGSTVTLVQPGCAFFDPPNFTGEASVLARLLCRARCDSREERHLFRALGVRERPRAADFAEASRAIAQDVAVSKGLRVQTVAAALEECSRGVHRDCSQDLDAAALLGWYSLKVGNLHMLDRDGHVAPAAELVWPNVPRWLPRLQQEPQLRFCAVHEDDGDWWDVLDSLVRFAGLRRLSEIISEHIVAVRHPDKRSEAIPEASRFKDSVEQCVLSGEFAACIHALLVHRSPEGSAEPSEPHHFHDVAQELRSLHFCAAPAGLSTELRWNGSAEILGSREERFAFYEEQSSGRIYVGALTDGLTLPVMKDLITALRRASLMLRSVEISHLYTVLKCGLQAGRGEIKRVLEQSGIPVDSHLCASLRPGDALPEVLRDCLVYDVGQVFDDGEYAVGEIDAKLVIGAVLPWVEPWEQGEGLTRRHRVRFSGEPSGGELLMRSFELYKLSLWRGAAPVCVQHAEVTIGAQPGIVGEDYGSGCAPPFDAKCVVEVKGYLGQMDRMLEGDYKAALRRLFRTWHPGDVGRTPLADHILRLLRLHEQQYRVGRSKDVCGETLPQGDESCEVAAELPAVKRPRLAAEESSSAGAPRAAGRGWASWIDVFEDELQREAEVRAAKHLAGRAFCTSYYRGLGGADWCGPPRIIDKEEGMRWLLQAEIELVAAKRMLVEGEERLRSLPSAAVWHCQQAVEMGLKAVMLRTSGPSLAVFFHDVVELGRHLRKVPVGEADLEWLGIAYARARYPNASTVRIPADGYTVSEAQRALAIAADVLSWASRSEHA